MTIKHMEEYRDPAVSRDILNKIKKISKKNIRIMEVCGTHTVSLFKTGVRAVLPETISLISGPGCPVCVTSQGEIDAFIALAEKKDVIITTFGDLMRVPGTSSSLQEERARGRDIRIVYSTMDAIEIAKKNPDNVVVFLGVGFETTAPTIGASIIFAKESGIDNFSVFSAHKLVPPALFALMGGQEVNIDGFLLPGHVSVIIGVNAYAEFFGKYKIPSVIAGFEPVDLLNAVHMLAKGIEKDKPILKNGYKRAVSFEGNTRAQTIMNQVFKTIDATWRGIGVIEKSGLAIKADFKMYDAKKRFHISEIEAPEPKGCACGEILTGKKTPPQCKLYKKLCTPANPVGPCMVSSEGTCAAFYRYH